jgi:hypothetical protein
VNEESIRKHFARMATRGFDPAQPHPWQYTVSGPSPADLTRFADRLVEQGFVAREPFLSPREDLYVMNVERAQIHTPESLLALSGELAALAEEYGVHCGGSYAVGWEDEQEAHEESEEPGSIRWALARMSRTEGFTSGEAQRWVYTFNGQDPANLDLIGRRLREQGFDVEEPCLSPLGGQYAMSAERVQVHSPESMQGLCDELRALAEEHGEHFVGFGRDELEQSPF